MTLRAKKSVVFSRRAALFSGIFVGCILLWFHFFWRRNSVNYSPCTRSLLCVWTQSDSTKTRFFPGTARVAMGFNARKLDDPLLSLDALHGALLEGNDPELERPEEWSLDEELPQRFADALIRSGVLRLQGTFSVRVPMLRIPERFLRGVFGGDSSVADMILSNGFPGVEDFASEAPFSELTGRETSASGVHHVIAKVSLDDLYVLYDSVCANEPMKSLCEKSEEESAGVLAWLDRFESYAGSDLAVDVDLFWALKGDTLFWANRSEFLGDVLSGEGANDLNIRQQEFRAGVSELGFRQGVWLDLGGLRHAAAEAMASAFRLNEKGGEFQGFLAFPDFEERVSSIEKWVSEGVRGQQVAWEFDIQEQAMGLRVFVLPESGNQASAGDEARVLLRRVLRDIIPEIGDIGTISLSDLRLQDERGVDSWNGVSWRGRLADLPAAFVSRFAAGLPEESGVALPSMLTW
jgi:hypothetical protein